ncbi:MAG: pyridoxal phosphate-dependent aminotransferase [Acidobacteriota bacterium]|jgi:aspartate aminotransferase|nr:pyridoxal phosphate-dependent aminotransferase [Acidobacteriota bacterium]NLT33689.1 pyridoxal phosphate-dependent aminotransferase [Acidobacteriota bacterium]
MIIASEVRSQIERSSLIRKMFEEGIRMRAERGAENVFDFSLGNPSEDPPAGVIRTFRALAERNAPGSHGYMPNAGFPEARGTVARRLRETTGLEFTPDHVLMTAGCAGAMNAALKAILNPGDEVIVPMPCFPDYAFYISNYGGVMVPVETREDFSLDVGAIAAKIGPRTRAIILNSPHNPSGVIYPEATLRELEAVLAKAPAPVLVLSDEPYTSIVYDGAHCPQLASIISNCMITTSWSKKWGLAGERIGYLAISPLVPDALALAQACAFTGRILGFINAPAIWQLVVAEAPDESTNLAVYQEKRDLMCDGLERAGYEVHRPQGAFYVFLKTPIPDDFEFVRRLQEEGVLAVPGSGFGRKGYMRLSLTVPRDTIIRSLPAFARTLDKLRG